MKLQNKTILVTGGGSGMGRELSLQLVSKGAKVIIADINEAGMKETVELAGMNKNNIFLYTVNIADKKQVEDLAIKVIKMHKYIDGIINNAGIIQPFIKLNELEFGTIERIMNINFYGTLYMIKTFLPKLLERPEAHIVNISSMGGFLPVPGQTIYGASKAAVKLLTEGLYAELKDTQVKVTVVFPGAVETNITKNSGVELDIDNNAESQSYKMLTPGKAAEIMINAIEKNRYRVCVGKDSSSMDIFYRLMPKKAVNLISNKMKALLH